jgi:glycosyltransferase involved in cell wall biosynthesis
MEILTPKISVIVPVYNVEQYLIKCIDSILDQDYFNVELILVNDGSQDNSGKICDEYIEKDTRVRVYHKLNQGVSSARNLGLENANGKYIWFVDADDWIERNCITGIICELENNDLDALQIGYTSVINNILVPFDEKYGVTTDILTPVEYVTPKLFIGAVCGTVFKQNLSAKNNIRFEENICLAEDQLFFLTIFKFSKKVKRINSIVYYYLRHKNSSTHNSNESLLYNSLYHVINFTYYNDFQEYCDYLITFLFIEWANLPIDNRKCNQLEIKKLLFNSNYKFYVLNNRYKIKLFLFYLFGTSFIKIYRSYFKYRTIIKKFIIC